MARIGIWLVVLGLAMGGCGGDDGDTTPDDAADVLDDAGDVGADADADADVAPDGTDVGADADADVEPDVEPDVAPDGTDADADVGPDGGGACTIGGGECAAGETCDVHSCDTGAEGECVFDPDRCPATWEPVCGCDGSTYANDCERLAAGTALFAEGSCPGADMCAGIAGTPCPTGQRCDVRSCDMDAAGTCVVRAEGACPDAWSPVCACDGTTYVNDCERLWAAAALEADGMCGSGETCGGATGATCTDTDEYCDTRSCGDGATGTCVMLPEACPGLYAPVCGCDGETYLNDCERMAAGADLDHTGPCDPSACVPECQTGGGGHTRWVDPCTGTRLCNAECTDCTVTCEEVGSYSEGWYTTCGDPTVEAGCGMAPGLIAWVDCG